MASLSITRPDFNRQMAVVLFSDDPPVQHPVVDSADAPSTDPTSSAAVNTLSAPSSDQQSGELDARRPRPLAPFPTFPASSLVLASASLSLSFLPMSTIDTHSGNPLASFAIVVRPVVTTDNVMRALTDALAGGFALAGTLSTLALALPVALFVFAHVLQHCQQPSYTAGRSSPTAPSPATRSPTVLSPPEDDDDEGYWWPPRLHS
jgi:hypothetical protein